MAAMQVYPQTFPTQQTLVSETDGNEIPTKYPNTIPIIVVSISLTLSFDFLTPRLEKQKKVTSQMS